MLTNVKLERTIATRTLTATIKSVGFPVHAKMVTRGMESHVQVCPVLISVDISSFDERIHDYNHYYYEEVDQFNVDAAFVIKVGLSI